MRVILVATKLNSIAAKLRARKEEGQTVVTGLSHERLVDAAQVLIDAWRRGQGESRR